MPNEKPNMSVFLDYWTPSVFGTEDSGTEAVLSCPADRPLILEMEVNNASLPEKGHICLLRATTREEELWAVRVSSAGSLKFQPGTGPASYLAFPAPVRDSTGRFKLSVSFDPILGGIVLATDFTNQILGDKCRNAWVDFYDRMGRTPEDTYRVTVGCQLDGRADQSPLGWRISAKYRFGSKYAQELVAGEIAKVWLAGERTDSGLAAKDPEDGLKERAFLKEDRAPEERAASEGLNELLEATRGREGFEVFARDVREVLRDTRYRVGATEKYTATDAALHRLYTKAAEGADHTELSAEWHLGVVAGARSQGWKGGKP